MALVTQSVVTRESCAFTLGMVGTFQLAFTRRNYSHRRPDSSLVRTGRLELPCLAAAAPKAAVSANSTTSALGVGPYFRIIQHVEQVNCRLFRFLIGVNIPLADRDAAVSC